MTSLPSRHARMALHLTDRALTPIISSDPSSAALQTLTTTAFASHDAAQRLGFGPPARLIVEYESSSSTAGPIVMHSFIDPSAAESSSPPTGTQVQASINGVVSPAAVGAGEQEAQQQQQQQQSAPPSVPPSSSGGQTVGAASSTAEGGVPALLAMVVAPGTEDLREARRATARLERVGREFQQELASEQRRAEGAGDD